MTANRKLGRMEKLLKKLNYKDQSVIAILGAPESFQPVLDHWQELTHVDTHLIETSTYEFVLAFAREKADLHLYADQIVPRLAEDAVFWMAYPKKSSKKYQSDITRDDGWQPFGDAGFEGVRMVALDDDWSALRLRHVDHIKTMQRSSSMALSEKGKIRTRREDEEMK